MPLVKINISKSLSLEDEQKIISHLGAIICEVTGKSTSHMMGCLNEANVTLDGREPAALIEVRGIGGLTGTINKMISEKICEYLKEYYAIDPENVYINFIEVLASHWGWNGATFG